jgi:uncharacterized repeat protein (TIGR03803 family)
MHGFLIEGATLAASLATAHASTPVVTHQTLYQFPGGGDGAAPLGGLVRFKGTLYGTTGYAGALGRGAVVADGFVPDSVLLDLDGDLIGTTEYGGTTGGGVIFSVHP